MKKGRPVVLSFVVSSSFVGMMLVSSILCPCAVVASSAAAAATTAVETAAKAGLFSAVRNIDYRYFVAGGVCAATSHGITTPIDVIKTKMQAEPEVYDKGVTDALTTVLKTEGPGALLGGLGPTVIGYGIEGAMKFGVYEVSKPAVLALLGETRRAAAYVTASVLAGAVASVLLCPAESARIRVVTDPDYAGLGLLAAFRKLCREGAHEGGGLGGGILSLSATFAGISAMLAKQVPYTMAKQVSFDVFAGALYAALADRGASAAVVEDAKWAVSVIAAFAASLFACIFSMPGDTILTETYKDRQSASKGIFGVVRGIRERHGLAGFFAGTKARIAHVGLIITSQLVIYDLVKQALGLPATGSH